MCGIVGVIDLEGKKDVTEIGIAMASALQHRGEEGAGILWIDENGTFQTEKKYRNRRRGSFKRTFTVWRNNKESYTVTKPLSNNEISWPRARSAKYV